MVIHAAINTQASQNHLDFAFMIATESFLLPTLWFEHKIHNLRSLYLLLLFKPFISVILDHVCLLQIETVTLMYESPER